MGDSERRCCVAFVIGHDLVQLCVRKKPSHHVSRVVDDNVDADVLSLSLKTGHAVSFSCPVQINLKKAQVIENEYYRDVLHVPVLGQISPNFSDLHLRKPGENFKLGVTKKG